MLFKTSGATFASVVKNQKHAFKNQPRDWQVGEIVLVSKNLADCDKGERQIQYVMELDSIRPIKPGNRSDTGQAQKDDGAILYNVVTHSELIDPSTYGKRLVFPQRSILQ